MSTQTTEQAIAAELRRLADELFATAAGCEPSQAAGGIEEAAERLRLRADELDPPHAPTLAEAIDQALVMATRSRTQACPRGCGARVIVCDNGTWLDAEPAPDGLFAIRPLGPLLVAMGGGGMETPYMPHKHQPEDDEP